MNVFIVFSERKNNSIYLELKAGVRLLFRENVYDESLASTSRPAFNVVSKLPVLTDLPSPLPKPFLRSNKDRQTGSSCCQGNSQKVCGATQRQSVSEVRKERRATAWWWNQMRGINKWDISIFLQAELGNVSLYMCVCVFINTPICANTVGYLRLKPGNRPTDAQNDRQALESWQPCYFSLSRRPLLLSLAHTPPSHCASLCIHSAISSPRLSCPLA